MGTVVDPHNHAGLSLNTDKRDRLALWLRNHPVDNAFMCLSREYLQMQSFAENVRMKGVRN